MVKTSRPVDTGMGQCVYLCSSLGVSGGGNSPKVSLSVSTSLMTVTVMLVTVTVLMLDSFMVVAPQSLITNHVTY
jgi:hypothetical protein